MSSYLSYRALNWMSISILWRAMFSVAESASRDTIWAGVESRKNCSLMLVGAMIAAEMAIIVFAAGKIFSSRRKP